MVVDYAHTPDSLGRTLAAARGLCRGKLWVVFGAGGERDQAKRPQMGQAASAADRVVLTTDNARREEPTAIAQAIRDGIDPATAVEIVIDRKTAIESTLAAAGADDLVLIAGKGHERTQLVGESPARFDDREIVAATLGTSKLAR